MVRLTSSFLLFAAVLCIANASWLSFLGFSQATSKHNSAIRETNTQRVAGEPVSAESVLSWVTRDSETAADNGDVADDGVTVGDGTDDTDDSGNAPSVDNNSGGGGGAPSENDTVDLDKDAPSFPEAEFE